MLLLLPLPLWLLLAAARPALPAPSEVAPGPAQCLEQSCYRLFWGRKSFSGAQRLCRQTGPGGHLMSVRSTVSAEVISLLLQQSPGGPGAWLWLGLRREEAQPCQGPSPLRGFHWDTGDQHSDYANWGGPAGPCGERCAAVLSDGAWEERECGARGPGFLCEYSYPGTCSPLSLPPGHSAAYSTPFGLDGSDFMALPPLSLAAVSPLGLRLLCQGDGSARISWASESPGPWHCQLENGGCEHICREDAAACLCPQGKKLAEDGRSCTLPPDPCASHRCQHLCFTNTTDHVQQCMCHEGYQLAEDRTSCLDVDDCQVNPNICDQQCRNTVGGFSCHCYQGYEMVEGKCVDIDECYEQVCEQECENLPGTYRCSCEPGFVPDPRDPSKCQIFCNTSECPAECDPNTLESCRCPPGYILNTEDEPQGRFFVPDDTPRMFCEEIDECQQQYCQQLCHNTPGSFQCFCKDGYILQENQLDCKPEEEEEGSASEEVTTDTPRPTAAPPDAMHTWALVGIVVGIVSMLAILTAIAFHLIKKHTVHSVTDYKCKNTEKAVVLQHMTVGSTPHQKL